MPHRITITAGPVQMEAHLNDTQTALGGSMLTSLDMSKAITIL